jgi:shikimate dehydrogenase
MLLTQTDHIDSHTRLVGLIGYPAGPWPLPAVYNAAFDAVGLNWRYVPLLVSGGQLREALFGLRAMGFVGAEVAAHYQQDVLNYLEELSPAAEAIGAANLIQVDARDWLVGHNVQWLSFLRALRTVYPSLKGLRPLVIGAEETASYVVYALSRQGLPITIIDPFIERAMDLVHRLRRAQDEHSFSVHRWPHDLERVVAHTNLIINTNAVGTCPDVDNLLWPDDLSFPPGAVVFDLVCQLDETRFLRQARDDGARTVSGLQLLVYEAALAFEKWTGQMPPYKVMFQAAGQTLAGETTSDTTWPRDVPIPVPT